MSTERPAGIALHQIQIEQVMTKDGDIVDWVMAETVDGDDIPLGAALGMLRLAEDSLIRSAMSEDQ